MEHSRPRSYYSPHVVDAPGRVGQVNPSWPRKEYVLTEEKEGEIRRENLRRLKEFKEKINEPI